jgi:hypothetical protein
MKPLKTTSSKKNQRQLITIRNCTKTSAGTFPNILISPKSAATAGPTTQNALLFFMKTAKESAVV